MNAAASTTKLKSGMQWEVGHIWLQSGYLSYAARAWLDVCDGTRQTEKSRGRGAITAG